jgi:uncharacterized protein (TIGR03000 family)
MYGIVLLAALTAGEGSPECFGRGYCGCYGGYGWGGCYGCYGGYGYGWGGCYGCYGGWGYGGGWGASYAGYGPGYASAMPATPLPNTSMREEGRGTGEVSADRAKVIIDLPTDAKLFVDGKPIRGAAKKKNFQTPALEKGQDYFYEMRAEVVREGKPVSETRRVVVRAGAVIRADFSSLGGTAGVASAKSPR